MQKLLYNFNIFFKKDTQLTKKRTSFKSMNVLSIIYGDMKWLTFDHCYSKIWANNYDWLILLNTLDFSVNLEIASV